MSTTRFLEYRYVSSCETQAAGLSAYLLGDLCPAKALYLTSNICCQSIYDTVWVHENEFLYGTVELCLILLSLLEESPRYMTQQRPSTETSLTMYMSMGSLEQGADDKR